MAQENKDCMPRLRFPEFRKSGAWKNTAIKEIGKIVTGRTPSTDNDVFWNGEYIWVTPTDISSHKNISSSERTITSEYIKQINILPIDSVLVTCIASIGKNCILKREGFCNQQINAIIPKFDKFNSDFIYYMLEINKNILINNSGISATRILSKSKLENLFFLFPVLLEQQKIADCLSSLDELIEAHEQKRDALVEHKKGLMQRLFPAEGETTPRWRFPEFRNGGEWVETQVKQLGKIITGKTPSTDNPAFWDGEYIWVTPTDIDSHKNIYSSERTITGEWLKESSILPENSVLITCIASIGKNCILKKKGFCNQQINAIIPNFAKYNSDFIYYILDIKKYILINNSGISATRILSKSKFEELMFPFPSLPEQQKIADCLSSLDARIEAEEAKIASLREHKQGLMQRLFPQSL